MEQRILTFSKRFISIDSYHLNLDEVTKKLNGAGWSVKQIVSTSFTHQLSGDSEGCPVLVITLLVEKP